jgi:tetratricopeptide (TPR) repeat protein
LIVKQWLESPQREEWILVIDNGDNKLDFYPEPTSTDSELKESDTDSIAYDGIAEFIPRCSKGTVIVTTRDREVALNLANQNVISKPELVPEQAIELFHQYNSNAESSPNDTAALPRLLSELQYLPLAIVQVAAYLNLNRSITTSRYLEMYKGAKESQKRLLSKPHRNIWRDKSKNEETILTTFTISFRQLQEQSQLVDSFLRFMAYIDRKAIPQDLLLQIKIDGVEDKLLISEAPDKLVNFSILQNAKIDFGSGQGYEIHSLVHLAMQTYLETGDMDTALAKASTVLADTLPDSEYKNWAVWRVYLPHAAALLANLGEDSEASADLCMKAGWYLHELGRYLESLILYERARKLCDVSFGEENTKTLQAMHLIGYSLQKGGRLKEAQEIQEMVLEVTMRTLGEDHPNILRSMQNLAATYAEQGGRLKEVQDIQEKFLEVAKRTLGEEHPDILRSMQNLAITYAKVGGRLKEMQQLKEKSLEVRKRTLGEEHPGTAGAMFNLALTLYDLERLEEAILLMEKTARSYVRIHGSGHSQTKRANELRRDGK